jgi:hypothetical protein
MPNRAYNYKHSDLRFVFAVFGFFFLVSPIRAQFSVKFFLFLVFNDLTSGTITKFQNEAMKHENVNTSAYPILTELLVICSRQTLLMVSELYSVVLQYCFV